MNVPQRLHGRDRLLVHERDAVPQHVAPAPIRHEEAALPDAELGRGGDGVDPGLQLGDLVAVPKRVYVDMGAGDDDMMSHTDIIVPKYHRIPIRYTNQFSLPRRRHLPQARPPLARPGRPLPIIITNLAYPRRVAQRRRVLLATDGADGEIAVIAVVVLLH